MKSIIFSCVLLFSFRLAEGQTVDAIRFVFRGRANMSLPTLAICVGKLVQPTDAGWFDSTRGSAILTDARTYNWLREYILSSKMAIPNGKPMCPLSSAFEMIDSEGMDLFVCDKNWRPFFDTLRAGMQLHQMDTVVIDALKSPPHWPMTPTTTKKLFMEHYGPIKAQPVVEQQSED
jgi:hypothetical protein